MEKEQLNRLLNDIILGYTKKDKIQKIDFLIDQGADVSYLNSRRLNAQINTFLYNIKEENDKFLVDDLFVRLIENGLFIAGNDDGFIPLLCKLSHFQATKTLKLLLPKIEKGVPYKDYVGLMQQVMCGSIKEDIMDYLSETQPHHEEYFIKILENERYTGGNLDGIYGIYEYLVKKKLIENKKIAKNLIVNGFDQLPFETLETLYGIINEDEPVKVNDEAKETLEEVEEAVKEVVKEIEKDDDYEVIEHIKKHGSLPPGVKFVPKEE